jgi:magnesium chelatase accessory protein
LFYRKPDWSREGLKWPFRAASRFVSAAGLVWHVQQFSGDEQGAAKPRMLLIHGTGASAHSWRHLIDHLSPHHELLAFDLPGHGFTSTPPGRDLSIKGMARLVQALLDRLGFKPDVIVGHSAGAVVGVELVLRGQMQAEVPIIALNGAFKPFEGLAAKLFPAAAKLIALNPLTIHGLSAGAQDQSRVEKLLQGTGSHIEPAGLAQYTALFASSGHVAAVLGMMARWDLGELAPRMARLQSPLALIVAEGDLAVPPSDAVEVQKLLPQTRVYPLAGLGHLAHEEDGQAVAKVILQAAGGEKGKPKRSRSKAKSSAL